MIDFNKLERDIIQAQRAINAITNHEDGGTCNFDTCCIYLGRKSKKLVEGLAQMDLRVEPVGMGKYWSGWWFVFFNVKGQGNCRTRMVECGANVLRSLGYNVQIYYQVD